MYNIYMYVLFVVAMAGNGTTSKSFEIWLEINEVTYVFEYIAGLDPAYAAEMLAAHFCSQKGATLLGMPLHTSTNDSTNTNTTTAATATNSTITLPTTTTTTTTTSESSPSIDMETTGYTHIQH